jgi:hypothetical protein
MRKSKNPRRSIVPGETIHGFEVIGRSASKPGKRMVDFTCRVCKEGIGTTRFSVLCAGKVVQSCRCLSKAAFITNQTGFANAISATRLSAIFTDIKLGLDKATIAAKHHIQKDTIDFAARRVYARLSGILPQVIAEIHDLAQISVKCAMGQYGYTRAEIFAICTIARQQAKAAAAAMPASLESIELWNRISPDVKDDLMVARTQAIDVMYDICGMDASTPMKDCKLLLPCEMKLITKLSKVVKSLPAATHPIFGGFSQKTKAIINASQKLNFETMRNAIVAREAGKSRSRRSVSNNARYLRFDPNFSTPALVQGFGLLHDLKIAA